MTRDEWKRVKAIAVEAWDRPEVERVPYITAACGDDDGLRGEVLSLVASMADAEPRFEDPAQLPDSTDVLLLTLPGQRLGAYEVLSRIGAGGMGQVYKARDARLDRIVAIKVLPARGAADRRSQERMAREARVVAALNHPHICTIYDIGNQNGLDYFVMEFVDGETLAARLARGKLPITEALRLAEQIATALGQAHRAGIVHRDVKPANIMLNAAPGGAIQAKLLDFGIAKFSSVETAVPDTPKTAEGLDVTLAGFVIGTPHYMAPEQLDRNAADVRTDIFAFGAVLFEMLTGRKAFEGTDRNEVLGAIRYRKVPPISRARQGVPAALDRVIMRCLAKHAAERYATVDELLADLRPVRHRLEAKRRRWVMPAAAAALVAAGVGVAWAVRTGRTADPGLAPVATRLPASAGVIGGAALSPDGSSLVFSWVGDGVDYPELMLLPVGSTTKTRLTTDPGLEEWPTWSPDGRQVAFIRCRPADCGIYALPVAGGVERKIRELGQDRYYGLAWSPDGRSLVYGERASVSQPYGLTQLSLDDLSTRRLSSPTGSGDLRFAFSPDGSQLAIVRVAEREIGVHRLTLKTLIEVPVLQGQQEWFGGIAWSDPRHLIISANQQGVRRLWRLPVSGGALQQLAIAGQDAYYPSLSARRDRLAFVHDFRDWDFSRAALSAGKLADLASFPSSPRIDLDPALSPDGRKLAFASERNGTRELWVSNADGTEASQLTSQILSAGRPSWSSDGHQIAFHGSGINVVPASGGAVRKLSEVGEAPTWSVDGQWIYFIGQEYRVWKVPVAGGPAGALTAITNDAVSVREGPGGDIYYTNVRGLWRHPADGGEDEPVVADFAATLHGYWTMMPDGIFYVARRATADNTLVHYLKFFDFAARRSVELGTLAGPLDDWVGGFTIASDRRSIIYSRRSYESREVVLVDQFR